MLSIQKNGIHIDVENRIIITNIVIKLKLNNDIKECVVQLASSNFGADGIG